MKIISYSVYLLISLTYLSSPSFALSPAPAQIGSVCRGEISTNIIEAAKSCSQLDLVTAQQEISKIEMELQSVITQLANETAKMGNHGLSYDQVMTIKLGSSMTLFVGLVAGVRAKMGFIGYESPKWLKNMAWAGLITAAMGAVASFGADQEIKQIEITHPNIPVFKKYIETLREQVLIRKRIINGMIRLKSINAE